MPEFILPEGLQIPTVEELLTEISEEQRAEIDAKLSNGATSVIGQVNGINASHLREGWEAIEVAFTAIDPYKAEGSILDGVCALTGTYREAAKPSRFKGTKKIVVNLDDGATVEAGVTSFAVNGRPDIVFTIVADDRFDVGGVFTNDTGVTDDFEFSAECTQDGPIEANAGTLSVIVTPGVGLNSVTNPTDAILGAAEERDEPLRTRRDKELRQQGGCTLAALKADLLALVDENEEKPIRSVQILENKTDSYDVNGLPPHSFEAVIWDGPGAAADDEQVSEIVAANEPAGIAALGSLGTAPGFFSRATQRSTEIEISLRFFAGEYAGDDVVKSDVATLFDRTQEPSNGIDQLGTVPFSVYLGAALRVQGVSRITHVKLKFSGGVYVTNQDITPGVREVAVTDTSLITVISVAE